jgi:hypothetical protein
MANLIKRILVDASPFDATNASFVASGLLLSKTKALKSALAPP